MSETQGRPGSQAKSLAVQASGLGLPAWNGEAASPSNPDSCPGAHSNPEIAAVLAEPGMPANQRNANPRDELVMRVGIPHTGGRMVAHALHRGYAAMVSAQTFWDAKARGFRIPEVSNLLEIDFALDSAGFTAMKQWKDRGRQAGMAGVFPWSYAQYLELANLSGCSWFSAPDLCCEPEIACNQEEIDRRIDITATLLEGCLRITYEWQNQLAKECTARTVASLVRPPVPVIQGWAAPDYERSLALTLDVWRRWQPWLAPPTLVGIGSVCRRPLQHPTHGLYAVLDRLSREWPDGSRAHLFGVKGAALSRVTRMPWIASVDSIAYDFGARVKARRQGISNTSTHRTGEMDEWMRAAAGRIQHRLGSRASSGA